MKVLMAVSRLFGSQNKWFGNKPGKTIQDGGKRALEMQPEIPGPQNAHDDASRKERTMWNDIGKHESEQGVGWALPLGHSRHLFSFPTGK